MNGALLQVFEKESVMKRKRGLVLGLCLVMPLTFVAMAFAQFGNVVVNGIPMTENQKRDYTQLYGSPPVPGNYWYDSKTGWFGLMGGPPMGTLQPGFNWGPIPENASNGNSGVYINGRHLSVAEVQFYAAQYGFQMPPGRYWMDAQGNAGIEGGGQAPQRGTQSRNVPQRGGGGDRQLVGRYRGSTDTVNGFTTHIDWQFNADGTVQRGALGVVNMQTGRTRASGLTDRNVDHGVWTTSNGRLQIQWQDGGQTDVLYSFYDNKLVFRNPRTKKLINYYPRLR
jgi:hypothetical protein